MSGVELVLIPIAGVVIFALVIAILVLRQNRRQKHSPHKP